MPKRIDEVKLFEAVVREIARHGYQGATTKGIAKHAGINEVTLFRNYGSKSKLVITAFSELLDQIPMQDLSYTGDLRQDLIRIVATYSETIDRYGELVPSVMTEIERNPELKPMAKRFQGIVQKVGFIVIRYQKEGQIRKGNIIQVLGALLGPVFIQAVMARNLPKIISTKIVPEEHVDRFLNGHYQL